MREYKKGNHMWECLEVKWELRMMGMNSGGYKFLFYYYFCLVGDLIEREEREKMSDCSLLIRA